LKLLASPGTQAERNQRMKQFLKDEFKIDAVFDKSLIDNGGKEAKEFADIAKGVQEPKK
jgi:hypothetical protein